MCPPDPASIVPSPDDDPPVQGLGVSAEDVVERFAQLLQRELLARARQDRKLLDRIGGLFRASGEGARAPLIEAMCELIRSADTGGTVAALAWRDPLASARLRGVEFKRELFASGELLTASQVAQRLHVSPSCVAQMSAQRRLLGLSHPTHADYLGFPAWQLEEPVLSRLPTLWGTVPELGAWAMWFFLTSKDPGLRELTPLEVLREHTDVPQDMGCLAQLTSTHDTGDLVEAAARRYAASTSRDAAARVESSTRIAARMPIEPPRLAKGSGS